MGWSVVWDSFAKQLSSTFKGVKVILPVDISPSSLKVVLFGPDSAVGQAKASIENSSSSSAKQAGDRATQAVEELSRRQSAMLTQDWRLPLPTAPLAPPAGGDADIAQHEALERLCNACERSDVLSLTRNETLDISRVCETYNRCDGGNRVQICREKTFPHKMCIDESDAIREIDFGKQRVERHDRHAWGNPLLTTCQIVRTGYLSRRIRGAVEPGTVSTLVVETGTRQSQIVCRGIGTLIDVRI